MYICYSFSLLLNQIDMEARFSKPISNVKHLLMIILIASSVISCGGSKAVTATKSNSRPAAKAENLRKLDSDFSGTISRSTKNLLKDAEKYLGAPYKFGGNTSSGFDCSGFTVKVFEENSMKLPRRSADQAEAGKSVSISEVKPGDLLFFTTSGGSKVSHVGIVHDIAGDGEIKFIHASTTKGVIISSLNEKYWNKAYLHAKRVL